MSIDRWIDKMCTNVQLNICFCCWCSVAKSCWTLHEPRGCSMPGFPIPHCLLEFTQVRVCWICDAIQPSHPLSSSSPFAFNLSQHQGLFLWVSSFLLVVKVLELQLQHQSFQRVFSSGLTCLISSLSKGLSRVFPSTTVWKHQFFCTLTSRRDYWRDHSLDCMDLCWPSDVSVF